jgi:hypothetical protein
MEFNNSTDDNGIVQLINDTASTDNNDYSLAKKARDVNSALNRFWLLAIKAEGRWQVDDTNQSGYPILTYNLVASQQDYAFLLDNEAVPNQILEIHRVEIKDSNGNWVKLTPFDGMNELDNESLTDFFKTPAMPKYYDKQGMSIFLYPAPSASYVTTTNGLRVWVTRTPTYFTAADTDRKAGIPWLFNEYLSLYPSELFAYRKILKNRQEFRDLRLAMELDIEEHYQKRAKDVKKRVIPAGRSSR